MSLEGQFIQAKPLLPRGLSPTQVADKASSPSLA